MLQTGLLYLLLLSDYSYKYSLYSSILRDLNLFSIYLSNIYIIFLFYNDSFPDLKMKNSIFNLNN